MNYSNNCLFHTGCYEPSTLITQVFNDFNARQDHAGRIGLQAVSISELFIEKSELTIPSLLCRNLSTTTPLNADASSIHSNCSVYNLLTLLLIVCLQFDGDEMPVTSAPNAYLVFY